MNAFVIATMASVATHLKRGALSLLGWIAEDLGTVVYRYMPFALSSLALVGVAMCWAVYIETGITP